MTRYDFQAQMLGFDDALIGREMMTWKQYTGGNPGYNFSWGQYKIGYEKGKQRREQRTLATR